MTAPKEPEKKFSAHVYINVNRLSRYDACQAFRKDTVVDLSGQLITEYLSKEEHKHYVEQAFLAGQQAEKLNWIRLQEEYAELKAKLAEAQVELKNLRTWAQP